MKGLLIKDLLLLKNQKNVYAVLVLMCAGMLFMNFNPVFLIGYTTFVFSMFTISTISYDEFDNGSAFLFSMPVSRKGYAAEKYLFGLLVGGTAWGLVSVIVAVVVTVKQEMEITEFYLTALILLLMAMVFLTVSIPIQLKFGAEKARIALAGVIGIVFVAAFFIAKGMKYLHYDKKEVLTNLQMMDLAGLIVKLVLICVLAMVISFFLSVKIMEKKQF